ncbi:MAG: RelA/SpoT family protein [Gammaproteobacteria bacterium]|nr:RelA/SpoT family protein [Gammaproteobacteria bacterium]
MDEHAIIPDAGEPASPAVGVYLIGDLCEDLQGRLDAAQIEDVHRAYLLAEQAHKGQSRLSGEPYIHHPLAVARTVAELNMDRDSIIAAILHDVIEDTPLTKEDLAAQFGDEVAQLVDGLSKLTTLKFKSRLEAQAANFRKMFLAMVDDIRVVLIKLADRLHNMGTLEALSPEKRRRIARETLEIYAPIANRLGIHSLKQELEDLGFRVLYPTRYRVLEESVRKIRGNRKELLQKVARLIETRLAGEGFENTSVSAREKPLYSIFQKMRTRQLPFQEVLDKFAIRIIVESVDDCYRSIGILHNLFKPVPGRFKDYIAIPKNNGYQSLHTSLIGIDGVLVEVQIRTQEMDRFAESGVAAHWLYKSGSDADSAQLRAREWLRSMLEVQQTTGSSVEFLENVKVDLFPDEIYIFSPRGDIYQLPVNATAVDFAYAIHSDIGHASVAARINGRLAPLSSGLETGQTVEILTAAGSRPSPLWLNFVVTAKARSAVRHFLKTMQDEEAIEFGRRLLNRALAKSSSSLDSVSNAAMDSLLEEFGYDAPEGLYRDVGLGNRVASLVTKRLLPDKGKAKSKSHSKPRRERPLAIKGTEGLVVTFGKCCRPIPGDGIQAFLSAGRGLVIHRANCPNVRDHRRGVDKWVQVEWDSAASGDYTVEIATGLLDRRGALAKVASIIAEHDSNIENIHFKNRDGLATHINFTLSVRDRKHLATILRSLRNRSVVMRVRRT